MIPTIVYVFREARRCWCVLRVADPGGRVTTLCTDWQPYAPVLVCTFDPGDLGCANCRAVLAARTSAAAMALQAQAPPCDVEDGDLGPDSEAIHSALTEHEDLLDDDVGAFDHLSDLREVDP